MKYIAELVLVFVAITQNVVATWLPAWLLPFGWPFLAATFVIYLAVKFTEGIMPTWATRPRSDRARWVGKWAVAVVGAFLAAWAVERFFYYGDLQVVDKVPLQVFPGEPLEVKGNNFALANAKSNTARLVLADKQSIDLPVTDVSEGKPQRLKVDIPDAVAPGPATLVIDGPLSLIYHNRASVKVDIVGAPKITRIDPPVAFRGKTELKVHGENFDTRIDRQRFKTTVVIGGAVAAVGGTGACQPGPVCLTVKVPEHSPIGSAEMVVSTSGGETSGRIRILGEPRIDHVSPLEAFPHKEGFQDTVITVVGAESIQSRLAKICTSMSAKALTRSKRPFLTKTAATRNLSSSCLKAQKAAGLSSGLQRAGRPLETFKSASRRHQ
jgi:hypothetical protein